MFVQQFYTSILLLVLRVINIIIVLHYFNGTEKRYFVKRLTFNAGLRTSAALEKIIFATLPPKKIIRFY